MYDRTASGALIQRKRLEARPTQEMLAEQVGCSVRHIVNVERGAVGLSIESMLRLCAIFRMTPSKLLFPCGQQDDAELDWLIQSLKMLRPAQRKIALSIVSPYIETALREKG